MSDDARQEKRIQQEDEKPDVYYVPGADCYYDYGHNVIVLDEQLKDYPDAHEYIKHHELQHATEDGQTFLGHLKIEFLTDFRHQFSYQNGPASARTFYEEREPDRCHDARTELKLRVANVLRAWWNIVLRPLGGFYREIRGVFDGS